MLTNLPLIPYTHLSQSNWMFSFEILILSTLLFSTSFKIRLCSLRFHFFLLVKTITTKISLSTKFCSGFLFVLYPLSFLFPLLQQYAYAFQISIYGPAAKHLVTVLKRSRGKHSLPKEVITLLKYL